MIFDRFVFGIAKLEGGNVIVEEGDLCWTAASLRTTT
jgi:hypothetical protein